MARLTGLWVYQTLGRRPAPETVAARAARHRLRWVTAQATEGGELLDRRWLKDLRRATAAHDLRLGVHGFVGRPRPNPAAEARALAQAADVADADFVIVNAEIQYEQSPNPDSRRFVDAYRALKPELLSFFSSFGRPRFHPDLDWQAWADGGFRGMPQAYENLNAAELKPTQCVEDWARFFRRNQLEPTLGCFAERGHPHLPVPRLVASVEELPRLRFNVFRHGTVKDAELSALGALATPDPT